jgi:hypothetical protein
VLQNFAKHKQKQVPLSQRRRGYSFVLEFFQREDSVKPVDAVFRD